MLKHRLAPLVLSLVIAGGAQAASLTPPNLVAATSLNNPDLLLVWPFAAGGPLEAMSWSAFKAQLASDLTTSFLTKSNNLSDLANPTIARTNLGLGSAALVNTGTSGGALCLLNTGCTWASQTVDGPAATLRQWSFSTSGSPRWQIGADTQAESGGNAGSFFDIWRYNDSGAFIDVPLQISRSSGIVLITDGLIVGTNLQLNGATSGSLSLKCAATCGSNTITFPAGTTNFSATGGTSQVVKQTSAGGALTVGQLACGDLSNGGNGGCAAKVVSGSLTPTLAYSSAGTSSFSYFTQSGHYVCVAGFVSGWARVDFTPTNGTGSGRLQWTNPPYMPANGESDTNSGLGAPVGFYNGWASISSVYTLVQTYDGTTLPFGSNAGTTTTFLGNGNSTSGTEKDMVWEFSYLTSTGTC